MKKVDPIAYQVAKKAAALQVRNAARLRVEAQTWQDYARGTDGDDVAAKHAAGHIKLAERAETLAREWTEKARCALDPLAYHTEKMHAESGLPDADKALAKMEAEKKRADRWHERLQTENGFAPDQS